MSAQRQSDVSLPPEMAEAVGAKIKSGAYASASDVICDGVRALLARDAAIEKWLVEEVAAGHREYLDDPSRGVPAESRVDRVKARRAAGQ
jgi:putative addiction module CopG family antidote